MLWNVLELSLLTRDPGHFIRPTTATPRCCTWLAGETEMCDSMRLKSPRSASFLCRRFLRQTQRKDLISCQSVALTSARKRWHVPSRWRALRLCRSRSSARERLTRSSLIFIPIVSQGRLPSLLTNGSKVATENRIGCRWTLRSSPVTTEPSREHRAPSSHARTCSSSWTKQRQLLRSSKLKTAIFGSSLVWSRALPRTRPSRLFAIRVCNIPRSSRRLQPGLWPFAPCGVAAATVSV
mmetsp:Transcript_41942/g.100807  ORF Transcript_41942/g.100807 Transcript_41942/m.100807 type:complete len:238 (+) Transcript_41942:800-1513(+)